MIKFFFLIEWRRFCCWLLDHDPAPADSLDGIARVRCRRCKATPVEMWRP